MTSTRGTARHSAGLDCHSPLAFWASQARQLLFPDLGCRCIAAPHPGLPLLEVTCHQNHSDPVLRPPGTVAAGDLLLARRPALSWGPGLLPPAWLVTWLLVTGAQLYLLLGSPRACDALTLGPLLFWEASWAGAVAHESRAPGHPDRGLATSRARQRSSACPVLPVEPLLWTLNQITWTLI